MRYPSPILLALATATSLAAQNAFPLPASAAPGSTTATENTAPFLVPSRMTQTLITNRNTLTTQGLPSTFGLWDMVAFDPSSRFIFVPSEVGTACGVFRYDTVTGVAVTQMLGNGSGVRSADPLTWDANNDEFARFDPCTYTPSGSILLGEETTGGRMFEVQNPLSPSGPFQVRWLSRIPAMAHEGTRFDSQGNLYVVDEFNSGSIYKFVPLVAGDLSAGQTFVLVVDAYAADANARPAENYNSAQNLLTTRTGPATWVPITDASGNALTVANPFAYVTTTGGRDAADEVLGTPYGRPEDLDFNVLASGNECLYCAITSENAVLSIELTGGNTAIVRTFCDRNTKNLATGAAVGTPLTSPDNLSADAFGNVYVIEDGEPNGGDIWKAIDANKDGVAEAIGIFVSLGVTGSEPTGMIWDPNDPYRFICAIQHPASGNDALWSFRTRPYPGSDQDLVLTSGINAVPTTGPGEFVRTAEALDTITLGWDSPNGTHYGQPYAVFMQPFVTSAGQPAFLPPLWLNPFASLFVIAGGFAGQFPFVLPFGGGGTGLFVPPGLLGVSVLTQAVVVSGGALILSDGVEVILE